MQWARWYKSIFEMLPSERPDDQLIADDDALDRWFDRYTRELARKGKGRKPMSDVSVVESIGGSQ